MEKIQVGNITIERTFTGQLFVSKNSLQSIEVTDIKELETVLEAYLLSKLEEKNK